MRLEKIISVFPLGGGGVEAKWRFPATLIVHSSFIPETFVQTFGCFFAILDNGELFYGLTGAKVRKMQTARLRDANRAVCALLLRDRSRLVTSNFSLVMDCLHYFCS